jgi:hypothetical protein
MTLFLASPGRIRSGARSNQRPHGFIVSLTRSNQRPGLMHMASFLASPGRIRGHRNQAQKKLAAAFIVVLRPPDLRPNKGGRCCIHHRAEAAGSGGV